VCKFFPTELRFLCSHVALFPHLSVCTPTTQPTLEIPQAEEGMLTLPFGATTQNHLLLSDEQLTRFMNNVQLDGEPQPFFFDKGFKYIYYKNPFFDDGHNRAIYDFQVTGQHRDYFLVTVNSNMSSFTMKKRVSPVFLNIMMRASGELDSAHPNTNANLDGMRKTTNILVLEVGSLVQRDCVPPPI